MANSIKTVTIDLNKIVDSTTCTNPSISYSVLSGLTEPCVLSGNILQLQIDPSADTHCVRLDIVCSDECTTCPATSTTICVCENADDCGECEICQNDQCVTRCKPGQVCEDDICVDCSDQFPCPENQICVGGRCQCPPDKPILGPDGETCYSCLSNDDCPACFECTPDGCKPVVCPDGECNPNTGECGECGPNTPCPGGQICENGKCKCPPGQRRDPVTGNCVFEDECVVPEDCDQITGPCSYCENGQCKKKTCASGKVLDADCNCVPDCSNIPCPPGSGCVNGGCQPCSTLSCDTSTGIQCAAAIGCDCDDDGNCVGLDCNPENVELYVTTIPGTPGTITSPGKEALTGSGVVTAGNLVTGNGTTDPIYRDFTFTLSVNNSSGTFSIYKQPNQVAKTISGSTAIFSLSDAGLTSFTGYQVIFRESGSSRTLTFKITSNFFSVFKSEGPANVLSSRNLYTSSSISASGNRIPPTTSGGTPSQRKLCSSNANFKIKQVTGEATGSLNVSFVPDGQGCATIYASGCGIWNGQALVECGGNELLIDVPEIYIDPDNCCDPEDPTCTGFGSGDPCDNYTVENIELLAVPSFGLTSGGEGEYLIMADPSSPVFFRDLSGCWSTRGNSSANDVNDLTFGGGPLGSYISFGAISVTMGEGGCVELGKACDLSLTGCRKVEGSVCLEKCSDFFVKIQDNGDATYTARPSLKTTSPSYEWSQNGVNKKTGMTASYPAVGGTNTITVTATLGECTDDDTISFEEVIEGCNSSSACNYDVNASDDDGSCCGVPTLVGQTQDNPGAAGLGVNYSCNTGFSPYFYVAETGPNDESLTPSSLPDGLSACPDLVFLFKGPGYEKYHKEGDIIPPGVYTVESFQEEAPNSYKKCTGGSVSQSVSIPTCYTCDLDECKSATSIVGGINTGSLNSDCHNTCSCPLEITPVVGNCSTSRAGSAVSLTVSFTGAQGFGATVTVTKQGETTPTFTQTDVFNRHTFTDICSGNYSVTVSTLANNPSGCEQTASVPVDCISCSQISNGFTATGVSLSVDKNRVDFYLTELFCPPKQNGYTAFLVRKTGDNTYEPVTGWSTVSKSKLTDDNNSPIPFSVSGPALTAGTYYIKTVFLATDGQRCERSEASDPISVTETGEACPSGYIEASISRSPDETQRFVSANVRLNEVTREALQYQLTLYRIDQDPLSGNCEDFSTNYTAVSSPQTVTVSADSDTSSTTIFPATDYEDQWKGKCYAVAATIISPTKFREGCAGAVLPIDKLRDIGGSPLVPEMTIDTIVDVANQRVTVTHTSSQTSSPYHEFYSHLDGTSGQCNDSTPLLLGPINDVGANGTYNLSFTDYPLLSGWDLESDVCFEVVGVDGDGTPIPGATSQFVIPAPDCDMDYAVETFSYNSTNEEFSVSLKQKRNEYDAGLNGFATVTWNSYTDSTCTVLNTANVIPAYTASLTFMNGLSTYTAEFARTNVDQYVKMTITDGTDTGCLKEQCFTIPALNPCSLSILSSVYDSATRTVSLSLDVENSTSVDVSATTPGITLTTTPASNIAVVDGTNSISFELDQQPRDGSLSVIVTDSTLATCSTSDVVTGVCVTTTGDTIPGSSTFAAASDNSYDLFGGLVYDYDVATSVSPLRYVATGSNSLSYEIHLPNGVVLDKSGTSTANLEATADEVLTNQPFRRATTKATGTLTFTGQPTPADTVTINDVTYTFVNTLTTFDDILIGATLSDTIFNLVAAIKALDPAAYEGVLYGTGTADLNDVIGDYQYSSTAITLEHILPGTVGNSVVTTTTSASASWSNATLTGGTDGEGWGYSRGVWNDVLANNSSFTGSACFTVPSTNTYYIGFTTDNFGTIKVDNKEIIDINVVKTKNIALRLWPFYYSWIVKMTLSAGSHIITVDSINESAAAMVSFFVLDNTLAQMRAATGFASLTILEDATGLETPISYDVEGGITCPTETPDPYFDGCTALCTNC